MGSCTRARHARRTNAKSLHRRGTQDGEQLAAYENVAFEGFKHVPNMCQTLSVFLFTCLPETDMRNMVEHGRAILGAGLGKYPAERAEGNAVSNAK